jgi:flavodoxin-like protein
MRVLVVYESMYGNTRAIANQIALGLADGAADVDVLAVASADAERLGGLDLLVLGAPTHVWGLSRPSSRREAVDAAVKSDGALTAEAGASGPGLREWLEEMTIPVRVAVFDTRRPVPLGASGSAAKKIARRVKQRGHQLCDSPQGFLVTRDNHLVDGELRRAREWGEHLARTSAGFDQASADPA